MSDTKVYVIVRKGTLNTRIVAYNRSYLEAREIAAKLNATMEGAKPTGDYGYSVEEVHELFPRDLEI